MFCTNCGKQLSDDALFCPDCGTRVRSADAASVQPQPAASPASPFAPPVSPFAPLIPPEAAAPQQPGEPMQDAQQAWQAYQPVGQQPYSPAPVQAQKKRGKGLWIGLGCLLLAALVAGGIWFLNRRSTRDNPLEKLRAPAENSYAALTDYVEELPNLHSILVNADALRDADSLRCAIEFGTASSFENFGGTGGVDLDVNLELCRDRARKQSLLQGKVRVNGVEIPLSLYLDPRQLQLSLPTLLREGEVLALPLEDLPERWNASALSKLLDLELPEELDLSGITEADAEKSLREIYGEDWDRFYDSVRVVPYEGTPHFEGSGETLTLSWDREALKAMTDKTELETEYAAIEDIEDLSGIDMGALGAKTLVSMLGALEEDLKEIQFYKENEMLTGVYGVTKGSFELRLCGEQNPWERITMNAVDEDGKTERVALHLVKGDGQLRLEVSHAADGEKAGLSSDYTVWNEGVIVYNDADGRITAEGDAFLPMGEDEPELCLQPMERGFSVAMRSVSDFSEIDVRLAFSGGAEPIRALADEPTDLLSMSESALQMLIMRIAMKIQGLLQ